MQVAYGLQSFVFSMKRIIFRIFTIFCLILGASGSMVQAEEPASVLADALLERINAARGNPLAMAESMGLDSQAVVNALPELYEVLTKGLPPLAAHETLSRAAQNHVQEMLALNYYGSQSADGLGPAGRMAAAGYLAEMTGEQLGILTFLNFMPPAQAVELIFRNMFQEELNPGRTEPRQILNPDFSEIGINIGSGMMRFGGRRCNAYLVACDYAKPERVEFSAEEIALLQQTLLQLINQARVKPLQVAASLGMDTEKLLQDRPDLEPVLHNGVAPLGLNALLTRVADAHVRDMLESNTIGPVFADGRTSDERIAAEGYNPEFLSEVIRQMDMSDFTNPVEAAGRIFASMLQIELEAPSVSATILNPETQEIGIGIGSGIGSYPVNRRGLGLFVFQYGRSADPVSPYLTGVVYQDRNDNGLYDPGEGAMGHSIIVFDDGPQMRTNADGGFGSAVAPKWYWVILFSQVAPLDNYREIDLSTENQWVEFRLPPE